MIPADTPEINIDQSFACHCPHALKALAAATVVGLLTGFLGARGPGRYRHAPELGPGGSARAHLTASQLPA